MNVTGLTVDYQRLSVIVALDCGSSNTMSKQRVMYKITSLIPLINEFMTIYSGKLIILELIGLKFTY